MEVTLSLEYFSLLGMPFIPWEYKVQVFYPLTMHKGELLYSKYSRVK